MLCEIDADFHSSALEANVVDGSLQISDVGDLEISKVVVEFIGILSYMCPTLRAGSNFADPDKPQHTLRQCKFLSLSQTIERDLHQDHLEFRFDLPDQIQLSEAMRKRLSLALPRNSRSVPCYPLPPSFSNQQCSYLQSLFIPWKDKSSASVQYSIKVTVNWESQPGLGRLLKSSRQKNFRKPITVTPNSTSDLQSMLPRYSKHSGRHWQRYTCFDRDNLGEPCSAYLDSRAKLRLLGDTRLAVDRPLDFTLELNSKLRELAPVQITFQLVMTLSTKVRTNYCEAERRNSKILTNRILVQANPDQVANEDDFSTDSFDSAIFKSSEKQLRGSLYLLEDPHSESEALAPPFTFAGLTIEYRLQVQISSPSSSTKLAFNTPTIILDTDVQDCPPSYTPPMGSP